MSDTLPITEARGRLGALVRTRRRITITDHGIPAAVLISPQELAALEADLAEARAVAGYQARKTAGTVTAVPHEQVKAMLGLTQG